MNPISMPFTDVLRKSQKLSLHLQQQLIAPSDLRNLRMFRGFSVSSAPLPQTKVIITTGTFASLRLLVIEIRMCDRGNSVRNV